MIIRLKKYMRNKWVGDGWLIRLRQLQFYMVFEKIETRNTNSKLEKINKKISHLLFSSHIINIHFPSHIIKEVILIESFQYYSCN